MTARWTTAVRRVAATLLLASGVASADGPSPYVLGVIPSRPPLATHQRWNPVAMRLAQRAGVPIRLKLYDDMARFEADLLAGTLDLAFTHPLMAIEGHREQGYEPLVRDRRRISATVFARKDAPIRSISDLNGKRIAVVGEQHYCTALLERTFSASGLQPSVERKYAGSSLNTVRTVLMNRADAGALLDVAFEEIPGDVRALLRPVLSSRDTASHPFSAHPRVPPDVQARIAAAFLAMARDAVDRRLLVAIGMPDPERADYGRDYAPIERSSGGRP